jgi:hypothetical protein
LKEEKKNNNSIPCFLYLSPSLKFFVLVVAASNKKREERERERKGAGQKVGLEKVSLLCDRDPQISLLSRRKNKNRSLQ